MISPIRAAVFAVCLLLFIPMRGVLGQGRSAAAHPIWADVREQDISARIAAKGAAHRRDIVPRKYRTVHVDKSALKALLGSAAPESSGPIDATGVEFEIPMPGGRSERFLIQESPIMEPKLAQKFPEIKTYIGHGIDDPGASVRIDLTPHGFHALVLSSAGQVYIDPYSRDTDVDYISYEKADFTAPDKTFSCVVDGEAPLEQAAVAAPAASAATGATLKTYRLALACTGEYAKAVCSPNAPNVAGTLAAMITSVNRVTAIYEREFAIRMVLVGNTDKLIYLDGTTDPYTNSSGPTMLNENQTNVDNVIGSTNYDIGHVFSTGGGGIASLGVVCISGGKARGVTGTSNPIGDPYDVDYVAHEMGHQFSAGHTFAGTGNFCSGNQNLSTAYEPGSASTIMGYAGVCSPQDLASHSDDYFHTISYDQITAFVSTGGGNSCAQQTPTGNNPPAVAAVPNYTIPAQTPFYLTASGSDPDGDTLTYCWEEFDRGPVQDPTVDPRDNGSSPLFRSYPPTTNPTRLFPSLGYILNNQNVPPPTINYSLASGEYLPITSRTMTFRVTVRDNHAGGGGSTYTSTSVTSVSSAGPFVVTSPNSAGSFAGGSQQTITWSVANTNIAPINCANVKISLSTDGGNTFPIILASSVPNNGSAVVTLPNTANVATTQGRIKVEAVGNIFFDISDANLTITSSNTAPTLNVTGSLGVVRGKTTATVATVGTASDAQGNALSVSLSDIPFGAHITPTITNGSISLSGTVDCGVVTTTGSRTYPMTLTVTDSNGSTASAKVNLVVYPNPSPTLGAYPDLSVARNNSATSTPATAASDSNGNLGSSPYSVTPSTLPGGGTVTINQSTGVVTATATNGTTAGSVSVRVTVVDSCGASTVRMFAINVVGSAIPSLQSGAASAPTAEGCSPVNGAVDPGETVTVNLPITNSGAPTSNLVATLQQSGGITPVTTSQTYGVISTNGSVARSFQFTASGTCGNTATASLQLQDGATNYGVVTYTIRLGALPVLLAEKFDTVNAPTLPSGWSAVVASGSPPPWATSANTPDSSPNTAAASSTAYVSDNLLISPTVNIPSSGAQLSFHHRWSLEDSFDGGILEISINGGAFTEIVSAGGSFVSGGYNGTIDSTYESPIAGSAAWTGDMNTSYTTSVVNLPTSAAGKPARFRWRLASDDSVSASTAVWRIDDVLLTGLIYACSSCSSAPAITNGPPPSTVVVGSPYYFAFNNSGNPSPTFSLKSGTLPPGLTLSSSGVLSGTVNSVGALNYPNITVSASNGTAPDAQQTFSLNVVTRAASYLGGFGLTGANAALVYDYDGDGISNLEEYGLGLNPTVASLSGLPVISVKKYQSMNYLSMTFQRSSAATDLTYVVQGSSDLITWTDLASSVAGAQTSGSGFVNETGVAPNFTVEVRDTVSLGNSPTGKRFLRLKITSP